MSFITRCFVIALFVALSTTAHAQKLNNHISKKGKCWVYTYTVINCNPNSNVTRLCVTFLGGLGGIVNIKSPPGWTAIKCPGAAGCPAGGLTQVCWTTNTDPVPARANGIDGTKTGFQVEVCDGKILQGAQPFKTYTRLGALQPFALVSSGKARVFVGPDLAFRSTLPFGFEFAPGDTTLASFDGGSQEARMQWTFDSAQLPTDSLMTIDSLSLRVEGQPILPPTPLQLTVQLSGSQGSATSATQDFAQNLGGAPHLGFMGPWNPQFETALPNQSTWMVIPLAQPFTFDPQFASSLVVDLQVTGIDPGLGWQLVGVSGSPPQFGSRFIEAPLVAQPTGQSSSDHQMPLLELGGSHPLEFAMNQPSAACGFAERTGSGDAPVEWITSPGAPAQLFLESELQTPWDVAFTLSPAVAPPLAIQTPEGQWVNIDLAHPTFDFLNGGAFSPLLPFQDQQFSFLAPPVPLDLSVQMVLVDPSRLDGISLSAASTLTTVNQNPGVIQGPQQSNGIHQFSCADLGLPPIPFFGTHFDHFSVSANGRLTFGAGDPTANPDLGRFEQGLPSIGYWCDLAPDLGGQILIDVPFPGILRVEWNQVPFAVSPVDQATFVMVIDTFNGECALEDLVGIPTPQVPTPALLGLSPGGVSSPLNPGPFGFVLGAPPQPQAGPGPLAMIYDQGNAGSLLPSIGSVRFIPDGQQGYDVLALP